MGDSADAAGRPFRIGPYTVLRSIGRGAMGVVYSAYDDKLDRRVALKHLKAGREVGAEGADRLLREAQALARLSHPNVVQVYEVGEHEGEVYLAMEFVRGRTLRAWSRGAVWSWREVLVVYEQAARGLAAAHAAGLVHRDFKPDNVMLGDDGRVRVMDFGLARSLDEPASSGPAELSLSSQDLSLSRTVAGKILGTPAYMAPEQHAGGVCEARTDQFAFCVALHEALYGLRPFAGDDLRSLTANVQHGRIREPSQRSVPRWLRRVVIRGLAVDVAQRWPSMQALLDAIGRGQGGARRRVAAVGLAVAGVLGAGAWAWQERERSAVAAGCAAEGASIEAVWDATARDRVRAALVATEVASGAITAEKVMPWLDRQSAAWAEARTDLCMDAAREVSEPGLRERAAWCLDERRTALESLVDELARADATVVHRAVSAAAALEDPAQCRDAVWLGQLPAPPEQGREALRAVQAELLRAGNLQAAGRFDDGLAVVEAALAQAEALAWPPLVARARHRQGSLLSKQGQHLAQAEAVLEAAYFEAANAGAAGVLVDAATELVHVVGQELARPAEGQRWSRLAEVGLVALEPRAGLRTANLRGSTANVLRRAGEFDAAVRLQSEALALREGILDADHPDVAVSLNNLGNLHLERGSLAESWPLHERALALRERALGPDHPTVADSVGNLANLHWRAGSLPEARAMQRRALEIRERAFGPDSLDVADSLLNLGSVHFNAGELPEARALFERSLAIRERKLEADHPAIAECLSNLGIVLDSMGELAQARALHERALAILERVLGPEHPNVAASLVDLALLHAATGDHQAERRLHARALEIRERALGATHPAVAESLQYLATIELELGAYAEAEALAGRALVIAEAGEPTGLTGPLELLAGAALASRRPAEAIAPASRALTIHEVADRSSQPAARVAFVLARALWDAPAGAGRDRARARELAARAEGALPEGPERVAVGRWLAEHAAGG